MWKPGGGSRARDVEEGTELQSGSGEGAWKAKLICQAWKGNPTKSEPYMTAEPLLLHSPASLPVPSGSHGMGQILKEKNGLGL